MEEVSDAVDRPVLASIREEWHWVRPALEEILEDIPEVGMIPEDVYEECRSGSAQFWKVGKGMLVTKFDRNSYNGEKVLGLWFAWSGNKGSGIGARVHEFLEPFARANDCEAIEFSATHQPLIDYLCSDLGYRVTCQFLRKDLE